ncbi:MAG: hypothetical protein DRN14_06720, partial [Thermoplasmata archaeon]
SLVAPVSIEAMLTDVEEGKKVIVRYFLEGDMGIVVAIRSSGIEFHRFDETTKVAYMIKHLRTFYYDHSDEQQHAELAIVLEYGKDLFSRLLLPILSTGNEFELVIIPDGVLNLLPFELLINADTSDGSENMDWADIPFLNRTLTITYAQSLSTYCYLNNQSKPDSARLLLAIGKSDFGEISVDKSKYVSRSIRDASQTLTNLDFVRHEVKEINDLFLGSQISNEPNVVLLVDDEALESRVRNSTLNSYQYIHFATHAIVDNQNSDFSALLLSQTTDSSTECDGFLYAFEIADLNFDADLVTLSACNTGLGKLLPGEGIIGFNRAFFAAGARALCLSLWPVNDESTSIFMREFYRRLLDGMPKAEALQQTKLYMIDSTEFKSPYYWAPFVLFGNPN